MPRRPRRDNDPQSPAMEVGAQVDASASSDRSANAIPSDSVTRASVAPPSPDIHAQNTSPAPSDPAVAKPRARRSRRAAPASDESEATPLAEGVEAPAVEADAAKPSRRPSRRRSKAEGDSEAGAATPGAQAAPDAPSAAPRRRAGGRRSPSEVAAALVADAPVSTGTSQTADALIPGLDTEPEAADDAAAPGRSRRSRRGGRRRRGAGAGDAPPTLEGGEAGSDERAVEEAATDLTVGVAGEPAEDAASEDDSSGRASRRSRRGGRRRSGAAEAGEPAVEGADGHPKAVDEPYELSLPAIRVRDRWTAPPLAPAIESLGLQAVDPGIEASVDVHAPAFVINGRRYPAHLFFVNADAAMEGDDPAARELVVRQIRRAASAGIHLHTCVIYLPLKNARGERSFDAMDSAIALIREADPDGFVVLRIQCVATNFWARTHPDQMARYQDGTEGDVSIASAAFWSDCVETLGAIVTRLADPSSPGHGRVFALHLDKGEWFYEPGAGYDYSEPNRAAFRAWLRERYQSAYAMRAAWYDGQVTFEAADVPPFEAAKDKRGDTVLYDRLRDRRYVDYVSYASDVVANVLCELASAVKELSGGKLLVFAPYGYIFEFASRNDSGHQALGRALDCAAIDVLTGPNSYVSRPAGMVGGFAAPVDSVLLHNKLWVVEDDTKTFLAPDDTPDSYNPRIAGQQETVMVQRRNYLAALTHGCGLSWMDLWGQGWLDSDSLWEEIGVLLGAAQKIRGGEGSVSTLPEAAVLVDEASYAWVRGDVGGQQLQSGLIVKARDLLLRSGASVGFYLQSDVDKLPPSVKVVFFLNAIRVTTEQRQAIRDKLQRPGLTLVFLYAPGLFDENGVTPAEVAEIVGLPLKPQPWSSRVGTVFTDERHPIIERLHGGKRMGTEEVVNPSFTIPDPQGVVLGEYAQSGDPSIVAKINEGDWRSVFVGEPHLTGELIRGIFRYSGVHLYDVQDDIVYARGDGLLLVHAPYSGQRVIHLPRPAACYSLFDRRLIAQGTSSVRMFMRGRSTHLLIWGEIETISARTGLSVDDLIETHASYRPERDPRGGRDDGDEQGEYESGEPSRYAPERESGRASQSSDLEQDLVEVLKAVVEEVYVEPASSDARDAEAAMLHARREAARLTEALLSDLVIEPDSAEMPTGAASEMEGFELYDDEVIETAGAGATGEPNASPPGQESPGGSRRSSRRRRWRRRQQQDNPAVQGQENSPPLSVDQILGDLLPRRNRDTSGESS